MKDRHPLLHTLDNLPPNVPDLIIHRLDPSTILDVWKYPKSSSSAYTTVGPFPVLNIFTRGLGSNANFGPDDKHILYREIVEHAERGDVIPWWDVEKTLHKFLKKIATDDHRMTDDAVDTLEVLTRLLDQRLGMCSNPYSPFLAEDDFVHVVVHKLINNGIKERNFDLLVILIDIPRILLSKDCIIELFDTAFVNNNIPLFNKLLDSYEGKNLIIYNKDYSYLERVIGRSIHHTNDSFFEAIVSNVFKDTIYSKRAVISAVGKNLDHLKVGHLTYFIDMMKCNVLDSNNDLFRKLETRLGDLVARHQCKKGSGSKNKHHYRKR